MKKLNRKGFTLIELLAVIIILALILVFAVPAVLDTSNNAQQKSLEIYAGRVATKAYEKLVADQLLATGSVSTSGVYSLTGKGSTGAADAGLGLQDSGSYKGCVKYSKSGTDVGNTTDYTITVYLTDGRFCTGNAGVDSSIASDFDVVTTGCPANYDTICFGSW